MMKYHKHRPGGLDDKLGGPCVFHWMHGMPGAKYVKPAGMLTPDPDTEAGQPCPVCVMGILRMGGRCPFCVTENAVDG